jgi:hypothetical protein
VLALIGVFIRSYTKLVGSIVEILGFGQRSLGQSKPFSFQQPHPGTRIVSNLLPVTDDHHLAIMPKLR